MVLNVAKIYSTLGNPNSLIPLGVKDVSSCVGMTVGSYATGKEEGFDRFIDEFGTEALWLGGIPAYKWLYDKTVFKSSGFDYKIDPRIFKDKDVFEKIKKYAPTSDIKKSIELAEKKKNLFKKLATAKFGISTFLAGATYFSLTRMKQQYTERKIRNNLIKEYKNEKKVSNNENSLKTYNQLPSFKGMGKAIEDLAFSPVKNMYLMDGFITTERLADSRNSQEFIGYSIKEGSSLFFLYYAGKKIQDFLEKRAQSKFDKSITLDSRVLEGTGLRINSKNIVTEDLLKKSFEDGSIEKSILEFKKANTSNSNLYEFLHTNPDNKIVQLSKLSDVITTCKNSEKIDTRAYVDLKEVEGINIKIEELYKQYKKALSKGETSEEFFKGVRKLKRNSIKMNMFSCILALGVITPLAMLLKRLTDKNGTEFQTKKEIKEQLIRDGVIA